jgi:uncharacterized repeat protein (TIGR01451 family)
MHIDKAKGPKSWLLWTGLLLVSLILTVQVFGTAEPSQALSPQAAGVAKTVDPSSVLPGQTPAPIYTVTFSNPATATLILDWITDTLPADFMFAGMQPWSDWIVPPVDTIGPEIVWQGPITVPANSDLSLVYAIYVPSTVPRSPIPYVNTVIARAGETTIGPATANLLVGGAALSVTKAATPTRLLPGQTTDYTVTFANSGELTGTLAVISDTLDPSLTFVQMLPGGDVTDPPDQVGDTLVWTGDFILPTGASLTLNYQVDTSTDPGWHWPCNEVTALAGDDQVGPARACIEVGPQTASVYLPLVFKNVRWARFTIAKSVTPGTVTDLPGEVVTYTVTIANLGDKPGKLAAVVDTLPAGFTYLDMAPGSDVTADPSGATGLIRWAGPFNIAGGGQLRLIYRVAPSQTVGQYTNSAYVEALIGRPPAGPASAVVTVERGLLLEEKFDDGISRWTKFLNYWRLTDAQWYWGQGDGTGNSGAANHECCNDAQHEAEDAVLMYLGEGAESWTDYRIEAKFNFHEGAGPVGLWVRGQYEPNDTRCQWMTGYYVVVGGRATSEYHTVKIAQLQTLTDCWGAACDNPQNLYCFNNPHDMADVQLPGALTRNTWHTLVVEVRGANIKVWYDGELSLDFTDPKEPFLLGTVGLKTYKANWISFDDIVVTPLQ